MRRIEAAQRLTATGRWAPANAVKLAANFDQLGLYLQEEQEDALAQALGEINPRDYRGQHPPARSYEPATAGSELFAFAWRSRRFGKRMYLKFSILGTGPAQRLYVYSLHQDRPQRGKS